MGIKRLTLQEFAERIGVRYSTLTFLRVSGEFKGQKSRAYLNCTKHGEFECMPLGPRNVVCPGCRADAVREEGLSAIKSKCFELFGDRIKIVEDTYTSSGGEVDIVCDAHGRSTIKAGTILFNSEGRIQYGCKKCADEGTAAARMLPFTKFVEQMESKHGKGVVEYLPEGYTGVNGNITYVCPVHGKVTASAFNHSKAKLPCKFCSADSRSARSRIPFEQFVEKSYRVHGDRYEYKEDSYTAMSESTTVICKVHGEFNQLASDHVSSEAGCPKCAGIVSKGETELKEFLLSSGLDVEHQFKYSGRREFDIYADSHKIAVEYDGVLWHSTKYRDRETQLLKARHAKELGVSLIRIFEDEWLNRKEQVKSLLLARFGIHNGDRVFARKCQVREISNYAAKSFLDAYHVQGWCHSGISLGLFSGDSCVAVMVFKSSMSGRYAAGSGEYELARYASKGLVVGGAGKLLKSFIRAYKPGRIVSFSEKRLFSGKLYESLGFVKEADVAPSYTYIFPGKTVRHHKSGFQLSRLRKKFPDVYDESLTEEEICAAAGYYRCYDDGKVRWALSLDN